MLELATMVVMVSVGVVSVEEDHWRAEIAFFKLRGLTWDGWMGDLGWRN